MTIPKGHWLNPIWEELKAAAPDDIKVRRRQWRWGIDLHNKGPNDYGEWFGGIRKTRQGYIFAETRALTPCRNAPADHFRAGFSAPNSWLNAMNWLLDCRERFVSDPKPEDWDKEWGNYGRVYELSAYGSGSKYGSGGYYVYIGKTHRQVSERIMEHTNIIGGNASVFFDIENRVTLTGWLKYRCRLLGVYSCEEETSRVENRLIAEAHARNDVTCLNRTRGFRT